MARVPTAMRSGAWTPPLARIEGDRLLKARQAEQRVREAQAKVEMEARRVEEMESQKLDEEVKDLRVQLDRLTDDIPKILPSGGGGKRMVAKVLARDYPDLNVFEGLAKADGNFVVSDGTNWTVESGATARASLGLGTAATTDATDYAAVANNLSDIASAAAARTNLNVQGLNADGGFTFATTATPTIDWSGPFGGTWKASHLFGTDDAVDQPATGAYGTKIIKRVVDGTGTNGPGNASLALMISSELADWLTNTGIREVDGISIALRSGVNGDASSMLFNGKKVYDAGAAYGMTGLEGAMYWTDSAEVTRLGVKATLGGLINAADLRGGGFGLKLGALIGDASLGSLSPATALLVTGDTGNWENILVASANGVATTDEFMVLRGAGGTRNQPEIHLGPRTGRIVQRYDSNEFSLNWSTDGGTTLAEVFKVSSTGAGRFTTADDSGSAAPSVDLYRNSASPLAGDIMGQLRFVGMDSGAAEEVYAQIRSLIVDPTATSEDADLDLMTVSAGTLGVRLKVRAGLYHPSATGGDKGNNTINFGTIYENNVRVVSSAGATGGAGSGGAGNQYVALNINGTTYKILHDGTV